MNSYRRNKKGAGTLVVATLIAASILGVDILAHGTLRKEVSALSSGAWDKTSALTASVTESGVFASRASLARQNANLQAQVNTLQDLQAAYQALSNENAQLRSLLHLASAAPGVAAPVTSSFRTSPYGTFTIGAGQAEGVAAGDLVATADGFAVGRVESAASHTALVLQTFAPRATIDGLVDSVPVALSGQGGGVASGEAPHGAVVHVGDIVVAPSLGGRPIGVVGEVDSDPASPSVKLLARVPVNLESLTYVYVEMVR